MDERTFLVDTTVCIHIVLHCANRQSTRELNMAKLTIAGELFEVEEDNRLHEGAQMSAGMAASLQQTRRENIRNNFSKRVSEAVKNGWDEARHNELQEQLREYASKYEFGVRAEGGGQRVTDPVEREARDEAKKIISNAYFAKTGQRVKAAEINEVLDDFMADNGDQLRAEAKERIAKREQAGHSALAALGLG